MFFFEDQGQPTHLAQNRFGELQQLTRALYAQISPQFHYRPELNSVFFQYRSRGGAFVPLAWRTEARTLGVIPSLTENPSQSALRSARSFIRANGENTVVAIAHHGQTGRRVDFPIGTVPVSNII